jgi:hypothetical protein
MDIHIFMSADLAAWLRKKSLQDFLRNYRSSTMKRGRQTLYCVRVNPKFIEEELLHVDRYSAA